MKRLIGIALLAGFALTLSGFKYLEPARKFDENEMPIRYYLGDATPAGVAIDERAEIFEEAYGNWRDIECSPLTAEFAGEVTNEPTFGRTDRTQIMFQGDLSSGVLAAAVTHSTDSVLLQFNGKSFEKILAHNIIFNSGVTFGTPSYIASPDCFNRTSLLGFGTHEIGHGIGLGHSCDDGEPCPDPLLRAATMFWSVGPCNDAQSIPNEDDSAGINAIYGVAVDFALDGVDGVFRPFPD